MIVKKLLVLAATVALTAGLIGCGGAEPKDKGKAPAADNPVKIGVPAGPHADLMAYVK